MHRLHHSFRLLCSLALLGLMAAGCENLQGYEGPRRPLREVATLAGYPGMAAVDGRTPAGAVFGHFASVDVLEGEHRLTTEVTWSNGFRETVSLAFAAEAGHRYALRTAEVDTRPQPAPAKLNAAQEILAGAGAGAIAAFVYYTMPIWATGMVAFIALREVGVIPRPASRPEHTQCYVWIEDVRTKKVVGGIPRSRDTP